MNRIGAVTRACAVGIFAIALLLSGCESTVSGSAVRAKSATPLDVATLKESQLDGVMLSIDELNDIVGAKTMTFVHQGQAMSDNSAAVSDPDCLGSLFGAEKAVYQNYDWTALRDQVAREPGTDNDHWVEQAAVLFRSADDARKFFEDSKSNWEQCGGSAVASDSSESSYIWEIDDVATKDDLITQVILQEESGGWECEHALSVVSNINVETWACANGIDEEARDIAQAMIAKAVKK